jgi:hypothetical protein
MKNTTHALLFAVLLFASYPFSLLCQSFVQDFQTSRSVTDYIGTGPNLFDAIESSGNGTQVSINGFALDYARGANNAGMFLKTALGPMHVMKFTFDIKAENVVTPATSAAILRVGEGFDDSYLAPPNENTHSRLGISLVNQTGSAFQLRDIGSGQNSPSYTGIRTVTWWLNHSGSSITYISPSGSVETLAHDRSDVYVGHVMVFNEMVSASSSNLTDFKFIYSQGEGRFQFDNFNVTAEGPLPVGLISFKGIRNSDCLSLSWCTAFERSHDYFEIQKSRNGIDFVSIGKVTGKGERSTPVCYLFDDCEQLTGDTYYRLKIVSDAGSYEFSRVLTISGNALEMASIRTNIVRNELELLFSKETTSDASVNIFDPSGKLHLSYKIGRGSFSSQIDVSYLPAGSYFLVLDTPGLRKALAFFKTG